MGSSLDKGPFFVLLIYVEDLKRDPNLENYPHGSVGKLLEKMDMSRHVRFASAPVVTIISSPCTLVVLEVMVVICDIS